MLSCCDFLIVCSSGCPTECASSHLISSPCSIQASSSQMMAATELVCEVYSTKSVTSSTRCSRRRSLRSSQVWPNLLWRSDGGSRHEQELIEKFLQRQWTHLGHITEPSSDCGESPKNKLTQRCGLPEKESGPTSEPKAKPKRKTAFGPCFNSSSSENSSSGSSSSMGRSYAVEL